MAKADVLALVQELSCDLADATNIERDYREIVLSLPFLTQSSLIQANAETRQYSLPASALDLLAVFYDDRALLPASIQEVELEDRAWRDRLGTPDVFVTEGETNDTLSLFPTPEMGSKDFIFLFGAPFGVDYPEYALAVIHTEDRVDVPRWLELYITIEIMAREFARLSDHQDMNLARVCRGLAAVLFQMVA